MHTIGTLAQLASAATALGAAWFWLASALGSAPPMTFGGLVSLKPWLDKAANANRWAASFAAASAIFAAIGTFASMGIPS
jgi:hypothetical protein